MCRNNKSTRLECPPPAVPRRMRVLTRPLEPRKDQSHAEGEEAHTRTDHPAPAQRRSPPGRQPNGRSDLPRDRGLRADLLPLEEPLRGYEDHGVASTERTRAGEPAPEEAGGRSLPGQRPAQGAGRGKLLSPARRRRAAKRLQATFPISERRTARVVFVSRSTLRYQAHLPDDEPRLLSRMEVLARRHPRYGYRVPRQQHKRRLGSSKNTCHRPERKNHIWALGVIFCRDEGGRSLKWLSMVDEYTPECPKLLCERSITAQDVNDELIPLMKTRRVPAHIRSDNGPEFIAEAIYTWLEKAGVDTLYVEPGAPGRTATPNHSTPASGMSS